MKGYLIDPWDKTVSEVEVAKGINAIYALIDRDCFQVVTITPDGDCLYVDDEGLYRDRQAFFGIVSYGQLLAGKALCLGTTEDGDDVEPKIDLETLTKAVTFHGVLEMDDPLRPQPGFTVISF